MRTNWLAPQLPTCQRTIVPPLYQYIHQMLLPDALDPSSKFGAHPLRICTPTSPDLVPASLHIHVLLPLSSKNMKTQFWGRPLTRVQRTLTSSALAKLKVTLYSEHEENLIISEMRTMRGDKKQRNKGQVMFDMRLAAWQGPGLLAAFQTLAPRHYLRHLWIITIPLSGIIITSV